LFLPFFLLVFPPILGPELVQVSNFRGELVIGMIFLVLVLVLVLVLAFEIEMELFIRKVLDIALEEVFVYSLKKEEISLMHSQVKN